MNYDDATQHQLMQLLARRHRTRPGRPTTGAAVARCLRLPGASHETRRRRARELVAEMRANGAPIASGAAGYWLATETTDFAATEQFLRRAGVAHLVTAAQVKRSPAAAAARGQLTIQVQLLHVRLHGQRAHDQYRVPAAQPRTQPRQTPDHSPPAAPAAGLLF